jgi:hypothetical protein
MRKSIPEVLLALTLMSIGVVIGHTAPFSSTVILSVALVTLFLSFFLLIILYLD